MATLKVRPIGYDAGDWDSSDYPMENAYDDDLTTVARCTLRRNRTRKCAYNFSPPSLPAGSIVNSIKLHLLLKCSNSNSSGACFLTIKHNDATTLKEIHLEFVNDGVDYDIEMTKDQYDSLTSLSFEGKYTTIMFTCYAYIFDMYILVDYTDLSQTMLLSDSEVWVCNGDSHIITANAYPVTSITWTTDDPNIIDLIPSDNGFSCNIVGKNPGRCNITATHADNSECTKQISVCVNQLSTVCTPNIGLGNNKLKSLAVGHIEIKKIYLGSKELFTESQEIVYTDIKHDDIPNDFTMNLYTRLVPDKYISGILCRVSTYIDTAGHLAGALRTTNNASGITGGDSSACYNFIPVYSGEDIIIDIPKTDYGIGLVGYNANKDFYQTWFGPDDGWGNYDKQGDADIEKWTHMICPIPTEGVKYIRWCMDSTDTDKYYFRRYSVQPIDLKIYPLNSTESDKIIYVSSDENVAIVENNMIKAKSAGTCTITITCGSVFSKINLTIVDNSDEFATY